MNLCINAEHAMNGVGTITITMENSYLDEVYCDASPFDILSGIFLKISVSDTGVGISPESLSKIFEPFFTTKQPGKGTGLGLAATYGIIKDHGGAITVYSEENVGTNFNIFLPLTNGVVTNKILNKNITKGSGRILFVDDEEVIRIIVKKIISGMGYTVITASNGKEALEIFEDEPNSIDLVILDMIMPLMDGRETFNKLIDLKKDVKVILSSGFSKSEDFAEMVNKGSLAYIKKPYTQSDLSAVINNVLNS